MIPARMAGAALMLLVSCGGTGTQPASTPDAQGRIGTSTAEAEAERSASALSATTQANISARATEEERRRPPCLVSAEMVWAMRQIADRFQDEGLELARTEGTAGMRLYETGIGYALLADCRAIAGSSVPGIATPSGCISDAESIQQLRDAAANGLAMAFAGALGESDDETIAAFLTLNEGLLDRAEELEIACGLAQDATPIASPVGG